MSCVNARVKAFLALPLLFALAGVLVALPQVVHTLDTGHADVTVQAIAEGPLPSRNVSVTALTFADRGLRQTLTRDKSQVGPQVSFFMPIADRGFEAAPTRVVAQTFSNEVFDAAERPDEPIRFEGVVRDVLWEGLSGDVKRDLGALHPVARGAKLLEVRGPGTASDRLWAVGAPLLGLIIGLFAAANVRARAPEAAV